jgi:hypothetical protein
MDPRIVERESDSKGELARQQIDKGNGNHGARKPNKLAARETTG